MAAVLQTGLVPILTSINNQLLAGIPGIAQSQIKLWAHLEEAPHFDAPRDIIIRPGSFISFTPDAAARTAQRIQRYINIYPRVRLELDPRDRDTQWLTASGAQIEWEESALRALWGMFPTLTGDSWTDDLLTWVEVQLASGTDPVKSALDKSWGSSSFSLIVQYLFALEQDGL